MQFYFIDYNVRAKLTDILPFHPSFCGVHVFYSVDFYFLCTFFVYLSIAFSAVELSAYFQTYECQCSVGSFRLSKEYKKKTIMTKTNQMARINSKQNPSLKHEKKNTNKMSIAQIAV